MFHIVCVRQSSFHERIFGEEEKQTLITYEKTQREKKARNSHFS